MRALDLFCGAGGASKGLMDAGFDVIGVDLAPQKHYPGAFIQVDVLKLPVMFLQMFDLVLEHAPAPQQAVGKDDGLRPGTGFFVIELDAVGGEGRHGGLLP